MIFHDFFIHLDALRVKMEKFAALVYFLHETEEHHSVREAEVLATWYPKDSSAVNTSFVTKVCIYCCIFASFLYKRISISCDTRFYSRILKNHYILINECETFTDRAIAGDQRTIAIYIGCYSYYTHWTWPNLIDIQSSFQKQWCKPVYWCNAKRPYYLWYLVCLNLVTMEFAIWLGRSGLSEWQSENVAVRTPVYMELRQRCGCSIKRDFW